MGIQSVVAQQRHIAGPIVTILLLGIAILLGTVSIGLPQGNLEFPEPVDESISPPPSPPDQLHEAVGATVSSLGRTALVRLDGSFVISNVPNNIGNFRVRLIHPSGAMAQSDCLTPVRGGTTFVSNLGFGAMTPPPSSLTVNASQDTFTAQGQTAQLQVIGNNADGSMAELTADPCTTYLSSNAFFATVDASGLVTLNNLSLTPSSLTITVMHEGVVGTKTFRLEPNTDIDNDGMPNDWETRNFLNPFEPSDAAQDEDFDGLTNLQEFQMGLSPRDPDTDRDGISDGSLDPDGPGPIIAGPDTSPLLPELIPPTVMITMPLNGDTVFEGQRLSMQVNAQDNVSVTRVEFLVGGVVQGTDTTPPFEFPLVVPVGVSQAVLGARAFDIAGNAASSAPVTVNVVPDPLTTVTGTVVDPENNLIAGATVTCLGVSGLTDANGVFSLPGVPAAQGDVRCTATFVTPGGDTLSGFVTGVPPVPGGTTQVGQIQLSATKNIGMVVDNASTSVIVFDPVTDVVLGVVPLGLGVAYGDCSITADGTRGFATTFGSQIWVIDLTTVPPSLASGPNPIPISNPGEDTSISPDGKFLAVCDGGGAAPVSVVDVATQTEIHTFSLSSDCVAVEVLSDRSVLTASDLNGNVRRLTIDGTGTLTDTGDILFADIPINVYGAPNAASGIVLDFGTATIQSFTIPGLTPVDTRPLAGSGVAGVIHPAGDRVYVRHTGGAVDVFGYDSATGALSGAPMFSIPAIEPTSFYGMDQMAITPDGTKLYVPQPQALNVYDASTGTFLRAITDPAIIVPTGVCFPSSRP